MSNQEQFGAVVELTSVELELINGGSEAEQRGLGQAVAAPIQAMGEGFNALGSLGGSKAK